MTPIPTPYDITEIPNIPSVPPTAVWPLVLLVIIICIVLAGWRSKRGRFASAATAFPAVLMTRLDSLATAEQPDKTLAITVAQQALLTCCSLSAAPLSPTELESLASTRTDTTEREILLTLAEVKASAFAPQIPEVGDQSIAAIRLLLAHTRALVRASSTKSKREKA